MKLVYPPKPIQDLYLAGFTLAESEYAGAEDGMNLEVGWNVVETLVLPGLGIIARLGIKIYASGWGTGESLGWRVTIASPAFGAYTLAEHDWRYGEVPTVWCWNYHPRLPFSTTSTLNFLLLYEGGTGFYDYNISYLIQDYS